MPSHPFSGLIFKSLWGGHSIPSWTWFHDKETGAWVSTLSTTLHCFFIAKYEILILMSFFFSSIAAYEIPHPSWVLRNGTNLTGLVIQLPYIIDEDNEGKSNQDHIGGWLLYSLQNQLKRCARQREAGYSWRICLASEYCFNY